MSRNGSGVYTLPPGSTVSNGDLSDATDINTPLADIESDMNTPRPVVAGGTGASSASAARTALGVAVGSDVQAFDAGLTSIAGLTTAADKMIYTTASDVYAVADLTAAGRALLDDANAAAQLVTLGAQPAGATLTSLEALALVAGDTIYATAADTLARLAKGTASQVLRMNSGATAPEWVAPGIAWQTAVATTSGDDLSLSGAIPSTVTRLVISMRGVSLNGTNNILVQLGTSGGFVASGYVSSCALAGASTAGAASTSGFLVYVGSAGRAISGSITLDLVSGNLWSASVCCGDGIENSIAGGGYIDLGGVATQIRISTEGANAFDAGAASVGWQ